MKKLTITLITLAIAILGLSIASVQAKQETCPKDAPWVKVDSDDLSQLPDEYESACFKFGSDNSQGCIGGLSRVWPPEVDGKYCGLSHFSYLPVTTSPSPSPVVTTSSRPTPTPSISPSPSATPTPTITPTSTPTPEPSNTPKSEITSEELKELPAGIK